MQNTTKNNIKGRLHVVTTHTEIQKKLLEQKKI